MNYATLDSSSISGRCHSKEDNRNIAQLLKSNLKEMTDLSSTCIAVKRLNRCHFEPESIPLAPQNNQLFKTSQSKFFFIKNRRFLELNTLQKRRQDNPVIVPNEFKNMLRAKSTTVKHKRLQEFYINREERLNSQLQPQQAAKKVKLNVFKPNFPAKKFKKSRNNSSSIMEKSWRLGEASSEASHENLKTGKRNATFQFIGEDLNDCILKEKDLNVFDFMLIKKEKTEQPAFFAKSKIKKVKRKQQKENSRQFEIEPWEHSENDDNLF